MLRVLTTAAAMLAALPATADEFAPGEKLTLFHCGRCHVVNEKNKWGGIDSTPSFATMRTRADFEDRLRVFYTLRPHPAFTQVAGVTPPFDPLRPPAIHPLELTEDELDQIATYAMTIEPADLGAPVGVR
jgi:mono/diheme cytochrome c family protein